MVKYAANPKAVDKEKHTALHLCCEDYFDEKLMNFLTSYIDINVKDTSGATPLIYAVKEYTPSYYSFFEPFDETKELTPRDKKIIYLITHGADINAKDNLKTTALHFAVINNYFLLFMLKNNADYKAKDAIGATPLTLIKNKDNKTKKQFEKILTKFGIKLEN